MNTRNFIFVIFLDTTIKDYVYVYVYKTRYKLEYGEKQVKSKCDGNGCKLLDIILKRLFFVNFGI